MLEATKTWSCVDGKNGRVATSHLGSARRRRLQLTDPRQGGAIPARRTSAFNFSRRPLHDRYTTPSQSMSREMALQAYRNLLRSARIAFQGTSTDGRSLL